MIRSINNLTRYIPMANSLDAFIPEFWAQEMVAILQENLVSPNLCHRDFENLLASRGDLVNTRKPSEFVGTRKDQDDDVTIQDAAATNIQVKLNQWLHTSFLIKDGDLSKSMSDLVATYLMPAGLAQARFVDQCVLATYPTFLANCAGALGGMTSTNSKDYMLETRRVMNDNKAYVDSRNLILSSQAETDILKSDVFTNADKVGDAGTALREASLGRKLGFNTFMCQNMASVVSPPAAGFKNGAVNLAGSGYAKGYFAAIVVDGFTGVVVAGNWLTVNGTPYRIVSTTATLGATTGITLERPLDIAIADNDVVKTYIATTTTAAFAVDWGKAITITTTANLVVGQAVSFGTGVLATNTYVVIQIPASGSIILDRPLDVAVGSGDAVNPGAHGNFNLAFHRNAIALVVRPLALPASGTGARSAVVNGHGLSMRATITYDGRKQGHLVTLDMLFGIKVLDVHLAALMLS